VRGEIEAQNLNLDAVVVDGCHWILVFSSKEIFLDEERKREDKIKIKRAEQRR
jgi:hypothetical protein